MRTLFRRKLVREDFFGLDSVQGYLEMAAWYSADSGVRFVVRESDRTRPDSMLSEILRLESEGYVDVQWEPYGDANSDQQMLRRITLTTAGHKLLAELQETSASGKLKKRLSDLVWVIVVSVLTTLLTLQVKGCVF
jgi:hypothetical protein